MRRRADRTVRSSRSTCRARELAQQELPSRLHAHFNLLVDARDHVWVREHPRAGDPNPPWNIVRPDGVWLGHG
ncbi:MAG: hypothetical protein U0164_23065 [Gemmatimonadaceae bacterium]